MKMLKRTLATMLSVVMMLGMMPATVSAASAKSVKVYLTVSNKGQLAIGKDNKSTAMGVVQITATDLDKDNKVSLDEVLKAAHKKYCPNGYSTEQTQYGTTVNKLWGVAQMPNYTFYRNGAMTNTVDTEFVDDGDYLVAVIMEDLLNYSDHYGYFSTTMLPINGSKKAEISLYGANYSGTNIPVANAEIKTTTGLVVGKTDENGKAQLTFPKSGEYTISASGFVKDDVVVDYSTYATEKKDCPVSAAACKVTVRDEKATKLTFKKNYELKTGEYLQIKPTTLKPSYAYLKYTSSNKSVVKVIGPNDGYLYGLKPGKATITVKSKNGGKKTTFTVTVKDQPIKSAKLEGDSKIYLGTQYPIGVVLIKTTPANATIKKITFKSSNKKIATVDKLGIVTGLKAGKVTITATIKGVNKTIRLTKKITVTGGVQK